MRVRYVASPAQDLDFIARAIRDESFAAGYAQAGSLAGMREGAMAVATHRFVRRLPGDVTVASRQVAGVPCEVLEPTRIEAPGWIVYLHGGGFVRGSLALQRANAAFIASAAGMKVLAIGYRQAPEHPFPAAPTDVAAVHEALLAEGVVPASVAVIGESSGGCLALGLAVQLRERQHALPAGIAAISPMVDLTLQGASWHYNAGKDVADLAVGRQLVSLYLQGADPHRALASPAMHDFRGCCPLLVSVGSHETMLSDVEHLARKASDAGADVWLEVYEGMPHGFTKFDTPTSSQTLTAAATWAMQRVAGPT